MLHSQRGGCLLTPICRDAATHPTGTVPVPINQLTAGDETLRHMTPMAEMPLIAGDFLRLYLRARAYTRAKRAADLKHLRRSGSQPSGASVGCKWHFSALVTAARTLTDCKTRRTQPE